MSLWKSGLAVILLAAPVAWADDVVSVPSGSIAVTDTAAASAFQNVETPPGVMLYGQVEAAPGKPQGQGLVIGDGGEVSLHLSDYWIGISASPPAPVLQSQLKLTKGQGLVVDDLQPDGPAAKAGVCALDILLKGNDKPLSGIQDLIKAIDEVKEGKLKLDLLHEGAPKTVTVTPSRRPKPDELAKLWSNVVPAMPNDGPLEFHVIRPGQLLPAPPATGANEGNATFEMIFHATTKLPDGTAIDITRHGGKPAKVVVTRGKEKWEGTSEDLGKIPEKVRPDVKRLLQPAMEHFGLTGGDGRLLLKGLVPPGLSPDVEKRLHEMQKQIDELRQSVEKLKSKGK